LRHLIEQVDQQIREIGVDLLERKGRNVSLTGSGEQFLPYASFSRKKHKQTSRQDRVNRTLWIVNVIDVKSIDCDE
jgi:hypothetical protein